MKINLDLAGTNSDNDIADELLANVGSSAFSLAHDRFFGTAALLRIWTGAGETGTQLVLDTDYTVQGLDSNLTAKAIAQVWSQIQVDNVTYQTGNLYFNYHAVADEIDALDRYTIAPPDDTDFTVVTSGSGKVGVGTASPSLIFSMNEKIGFTPIGGLAIKLTNKTGSNTVAGQLVKIDTATDDAFILSIADEDETTGIVFESGIADGSEAWMVVSGIADVAMEDSTAATRGNWVRTSITEAGYADATNAAPPGGGIPELDRHMKEIGNCIETVSAGGGGTHILARCIIHFN